MTTTMYAPAKATDAQLSFISDLRAKREVPSALDRNIGGAIARGMTRLEASTAISLLKGSPFKAPARVEDPLQALLADVPHAKYALAAQDVNAGLHNLQVNNDYLFIEVSVTRGRVPRLVLRQLHGSPGGFWRSRLTSADAQFLARMVGNPIVALTATQKFGEIYSCCGKCAAELTDQVSRDLKLGPVCRQRFGL